MDAYLTGKTSQILTRPLFMALILANTFLITACATQPKPPKGLTADLEQTKTSTPSGGLVSTTLSETGRNMPNAVQAPLRDFNLNKVEIPPILLSIEYPYRLNGPVYCDQLIAEITALNEVLGMSEDIDTIELSTSEKAAQSASNAAQSAIEDAATGWIPYRSVLRRISGATAHERDVRSAYEMGRVRRAFLKGVGGAFQCPYPARPLSVVEPQRHP